MRRTRLGRLLPASLLLLLGACVGEPSAPHAPAPSPAPHLAAPTTESAAGADVWRSAALPPWYDPAAHDTITVVAWNIEHFVDDWDSPYIDHPRENNPNPNLPERRRLLAEAIRVLDPDIVVFQEVESASFIEAWAGEHLADMGYRHFTGRESTDWYMNVIIMSRLPLGLMYSYSNVYTYIHGEVDSVGNTDRQSFTNNRMVSVDVHVNPEYTFTLTGVHLKAGRSDRDVGWRKGQLDLLREHWERILRADPGARILLAGDLNTLPGDEEYLRALGEGTDVVLMDALGGRETLTPPADTPTRQLDHIIPNQNMMPDLVPGSARVPTPFDAATMRLISDHLPVKARFVTVRERD